MKPTQYQYDFYKVQERAEELIKASSNLYKITVQVANRAKRYRDDDSEYDSPMKKPVSRAIMEMSDELTEPMINVNYCASFGAINESRVQKYVPVLGKSDFLHRVV